MSYSKYPEQIQHYHDLFEGDFFSAENQQLFAQVNDVLKHRIFKMLTIETESVLQDTSLKSSHGAGHLKSIYRHTLMRGYGGAKAIHPFNYLPTLNSVDRENLAYLLFEVLYDRDKGIYRSNMNTAMIIGSTTYDDDYRNDFADYAIDAATQYRCTNKGNDIDIMLSHTNYPTRPKSFDYDFMAELLQKYNVPYIFHEDKKDDGTTYIIKPDHIPGDVDLIPGKIESYGCPNFVVTFPKGRPIHICIDDASGDMVYKKEFLQGRPYCILFEGSNEKSMCKDVFDQIARGKAFPALDTIEQRYYILQENRKSYTQNKLAGTIRKNKDIQKSKGNPDYKSL